MAEGDLEPLDLLLYAPLGAAIELRSRLPELATSGRRHLGMQVLTARSIGQFAVTQARRQLPSVLDDLRDRGLETLSNVGLVSGQASTSATVRPVVSDRPKIMAPVYMLSRAKMAAFKSERLARSTSSLVTPLASSLAISASMAASSFASGTPGRGVAEMPTSPWS